MSDRKISLIAGCAVFALTSFTAVLSMVSFAASGAALAQDASFDVVGVTLGMKPEEALNRLRAYNKENKIEPYEFKLPVLHSHPVLFSFSSRSPNERIRVRFTLPPNEQVVYQVARGVNYSQGNEPAMETMIDALKQKYGRESHTSGTANPNFVWVFDEKGRPVGGEASRKIGLACTGFTPEYLGHQSHSDGQFVLPRLQNPTSRNAPGSCQSYIVILARVMQARGPSAEYLNAVRDLTVSMTNVALDVRATKASRAVVQQARKDAAKQQHEKAKGRKPTL